MAGLLDADAVRRWCHAGRDALRERREEIDALNVFPVPDGDTGTNLLLTMEAVADGLGAPADRPATVRAMARAALLGARGNSGVILAQFLRGISDLLAEGGQAPGEELAGALERAAELCYAAVAQPVEGTVLTVARAAATGARAAIAAASRRPPDAATVARAAAEAAADALARTPLQLAALARAGVVDAGGRGLVVLLEALVAVLAGEPVELARAQVLARGRSGIVATREAGSETFGYEVQYLLDAPDAEIPSLRAALGALGDCLVIVGGEGLWNVHVHVNVVGAAIEAGIEAGRPHRISVTRFADQIEAGSLPGEAPGRRRSVVAVVPGGGLTALFSTAGACVLAGGPTANPSTQEVLDAIIGSAATEVVVLPNDATVRGVAEAAAIVARDEGLVVAVVPTKSPVQGLAALAVHDPDRRFSDDVIAMTAAAGATRWAEVTIAVREAQTSAGVCRPGDVLGLVEGDVTLMGSQIREVACGLLDRLLDGGGELVTLVTGADADEDLGAALCEYLGRTRPAVETVVYSGGQPHYPLLVGVE